MSAGPAVGYTVVNTRDEFKKAMIQLKERVKELTLLYKKAGEKAGESKMAAKFPGAAPIDRSAIMIDMIDPITGVASKKPLKVSELNTIRKALFRYILSLRFRYTVNKTTRVDAEGNRVSRPSQSQFAVLKPGFFGWLNPEQFVYTDANGVQHRELANVLGAYNYHVGEAATGGSQLISRKVVNQLFHAFKAIHAQPARGVPLITEENKRPIVPRLATKLNKTTNQLEFVERPYREITPQIRAAWGTALIPDVTFTRYVSIDDLQRASGLLENIPPGAWKEGISQRDPMKVITRMTFKKRPVKPLAREEMEKKGITEADYTVPAIQQNIDAFKTTNKTALEAQEATISNAIYGFTSENQLSSAKKAKKKKRVM